MRIIVLNVDMYTGACFDKINPSGAFDEVILLEILSKSLDEIFGREVFDGEEGLWFLSEHWW